MTANPQPVTVTVDLGEKRSYPIQIGKGWIDGLGECLSPFFPARRCVLVTNPSLGRSWSDRIKAALTESGYDVQRCEIPEGEKNKTLNTVSMIYDYLVQGRHTRQSGLIALGGGVTGDIGGFAAATFMRGIPYIQLPTSLLAMVDSSVGGKTGVNHPQGKNLIGAFWQPTFVGIELECLGTLPAEELRAGMAEVIKYGVIADSAFFEYLEQNIEAALALDAGVLTHVVRRSCELKAEVVAQDEREGGVRAILNFGHTFGHAAEALSHYRKIRHGEGVAMGMMAATRLAEARGYVGAELTARLEGLLGRAGLPTKMLAYKPEAYWESMQSDKKVKDGRVRFVLPRALGQVSIENDITREEAMACL